MPMIAKFLSVEKKQHFHVNEIVKSQMLKLLSVNTTCRRRKNYTRSWEDVTVYTTQFVLCILAYQKTFNTRHGHENIFKRTWSKMQNIAYT